MRFSLRIPLLLLLCALVQVTVLFPAAFAPSIRLDGCDALMNGEVAQQILALHGSLSIGVRFYIENGQGPSQIGLGVTMTDPNGRPWNDPANDRWNVPIPSGYSTQDRYFSPDTNTYGPMPTKIQGSYYQLTCAIWTGKPGYSQWITSVTKSVLVIDPFGS